MLCSQMSTSAKIMSANGVNFCCPKSGKTFSKFVPKNQSKLGGFNFFPESMIFQNHLSIFYFLFNSEE